MNLKHTYRWKTEIENERGQDCARTRLYESQTADGSILAVSQGSTLLVLAGSGMQAYANRTIDAFFVALFLLVVGVAVTNFIFPGKKSELRAFLLTYGICVFVGGLAQCYSLFMFNNPQSTIDSFIFLRSISPQPPFTTMENIGSINSPLAILIWQQVYKSTWWLGFEFGPYTGVMFNGLVMGLTGSLTVRAAREIFGNDIWRLCRVGTLFASCGLFILFGAVLIRDCFTIFFNTLVLWGLIAWLVRPTLRKLIFATALTGISAYAMSFLRIEATLLFGLFWFLALLFWSLTKRLNIARLTAIFFALGILLAASSYLISYMQRLQQIQARGMESYAEFAIAQNSEGSLGMRLIINQPLPIRLLLGSGALMINPIPLWINFKLGSPDYTWLKGYHGIYQVFVLPLVFAGCIVTFQQFQKNRNQAVPILFLTVYLLMNTIVVVATSFEQRHLAQFMPAFIILAALPDTRRVEMNKSIHQLTKGWFITVLLVHLVWAIMKGIA